jgi:hypothetical protein
VTGTDELRVLNEADVTLGYKTEHMQDDVMHPYNLGINVVNEFSNILILEDPQLNLTNIFDAIH